MKYLGIDYGEKRVGIAVSDERGSIAFPRDVILNQGVPDLIKHIERLIKKEHIKKIILGLPALLDGKESNQTKKTKRFGAMLREKIGCEAVYENEMFTTRMVKIVSPIKKHDASSAALILQAYLDKLSYIKE